MTKILFAAFLLGGVLPAHAAPLPFLNEASPSAALSADPAPSPGWARVQSLKPGTRIHVNGKVHVGCSFLSADDVSLLCARGSSGPIKIDKSGITTIKLAHRGRSTLVGMAVGAGIGLAVGFGAGTDNKDGFFGPNSFRGAIAAIGAVIGAIIVAPVGFFTDFTAGTPIYKAG